MMEESITTVYKQLDELERIFSEIFLDIEFIGETPIRREDYNHLLIDFREAYFL